MELLARISVGAEAGEPWVKRRGLGRPWVGYHCTNRAPRKDGGEHYPCMPCLSMGWQEAITTWRHWGKA
ncbi:MAG TPA: hypothetical protein VK196_08780 [Magnetospirillum sp.]|nr:hypothetical protein [Magnetospirillum sp.]